MVIFRLIIQSFLCVFFICITYGQEADNWYFGEGAALNFSSGFPLPIVGSQMFAPEACASMSDHNGQLLFYTNGKTVWNKNHEIMLNGNDLFGDPSSVQILTIQHPGNENQYYLFTIGLQEGGKALRYSIIDMTAEGGLGEVITKDIFLYGHVTEQVTATRHPNGVDIWVVTHGWNNSNFYAFKVTASGIEAPVISTVDPYIGGSLVNGLGALKFSQQGDRLLSSAYNQVLLYNFNNITGIVSAPFELSNQGTVFNPGEFSPSGEFVYATNGTSLIQYNLLATDIVGSATTIAANSNEIGLQLAPDQKIYITRASPGQKISVINFPDLQGINCDYQYNAIDIVGLPRMGLPFFLPPRVQTLIINTEDICVGENNSFSFTSNIENFDSYFWDFGDGSTSNQQAPQHTYSLPGTYHITLTVTKQQEEYVAYKTIIVYPTPIANMASDLVLCDNEPFDEKAIFNLATQDSSILGNQSSENYTITYHITLADAEMGNNAISTIYENISNPQTIFVRISANTANCYAITSFQIRVVPLFSLVINSEYYICENDSVIIIAPDGMTEYLWSTGETSQSISISEPGNYTVTISNENCNITKQFTVSSVSVPVIDYIDIQDWNNYSNSIIVYPSISDNYEYSIDNINFQSENTFHNLSPGSYIVYVKNICGIVTQQVSLLNYPKFFTPNGDGIHDYWRIPFGTYEPEMKISIFDRYGKLIKVFYGDDIGWDGTLKGKKLPSTDYWFVAERKDNTIHKGHFTLKR